MPVRPRPRNDRPASAATNAGRPSEIDDHDRRDQVGQQLLEQDPPGRHADHLGGLDELALAQRQHLAADQPGQPHPAEDASGSTIRAIELRLGELVEVGRRSAR